MKSIALPSSDAWITTVELAELAGISPARVWRAAIRCEKGKAWRGSLLLVRRVVGKSGRGGMRYEVAVSSLPASLRSLYRPAEVVDEIIRPVQSDDKVWRQRFEWIKPILEARARGEDEASARAITVAKLGAQSGDTLKEWVRRYDDQGFEGLKRRTRSDKQIKKTVITSDWDRAASNISAAAQAEIGAQLFNYIESLYANGVPSARHVCEFATAKLVELSKVAGIDLGKRPAEICRVPRHVVEKCRKHRLIAIKRNDAKLYHSKFEPRISRLRTNLLPLGCVTGDVHHIDILYLRDDGARATAKLVAWADEATRRVIASVVFLEKGEGVRQEHVMASFVDMVCAWGVPSSVMCDNGSEYGWDRFVQDLLRCAAITGHSISPSGVIRTRPYNAQSKGIEGIFANLERGYFSLLPGYIGGERTAKKTQNIGREPVPFSGTKEELRIAIDGAIARYNATPQVSGELKEQSPNDRFREFVERGWTKTAIGRAEIEAVFSEEFTSKADRGRVRVKNTIYYHDALLPFTGDRVRILYPRIGNRDQVAVLSGEKVLCFAIREEQFAFGDKAGAREQSRRSRMLRDHLKNLERSTEKLDLIAEGQKVVELRPRPVEAPVGSNIFLSSEISAIGMARAALHAPVTAPDLEAEPSAAALLRRLVRQGKSE